jgi:hypothetical protein
MGVGEQADAQHDQGFLLRVPAGEPGFVVADAVIEPDGIEKGAVGVGYNIFHKVRGKPAIKMTI